MTTTGDGLEPFRKRFFFDAWREPAAADATLFVWQFFLGGRELPDYRLLRAESEEISGWGASTSSLWAGAGDEVLLRADVYEAASRQDARSVLLRQLGEFQSPLLERKSEAAGEVAFGMPGDQALAFVRANVVVVVRNGGREIQSVATAAYELDRLVTAPAEVGGSQVRAEIRRVEAEGRPAVGEPVAIDVEAEDPLGRRLWYHFAAPSGEFVSSEGRVYFIPAEGGKQTLEVTVVNENLGVAEQRLDLRA